MSGRRRSHTVIVVLVLTAVTLMTLDLRDVGGGPLARVQTGAMTVFAPVAHLVSSAVRPVTSASGWVADQRRLHAELERLRTAAAERDAVTAERDDVLAENARLRDLLELRDTLDLRTRAVRVLGAASGDAGATVFVAAGSDDGLAVDMVVVDVRGVVGRVATVSDRYAAVELITSPRARFAARVVVGRHTGRLSGRGDGTLWLDLDDPTADVAAGTAVVTRAFEGSAVPDGLPLGTVARTGAGSALQVRPAAALTALDVVQVVVAPSAPVGPPRSQAHASSRSAPAVAVPLAPGVEGQR